MNLGPHAWAERPVDELMAGEAALAGKFRRDDACRKMRVVVRFDPDFGPREAGADELCNLFGIHGAGY